MPKINQEEYEVLKGLDDKWKWIARDKDNTLVMGAGKNERYLDGWFPPVNVGDSLVADEINAVKVISEWGNLFQFIQWEDEDSYDIQELIEEYLYDNQPKLFIDGQEQSFEFIEESEEKEVKKQKLIEKWESAIEAAEFYGKGKEDRLIEYMRDFVDDLNQLDEPEVLSSDWIEEHHYIRMDPDNPFVYVKDLQNLLVPKQEITEEQAWEIIHGKYGDEVLQNNIDYVESQGYVVIEKPTVPQFVADWHVQNKYYLLGAKFERIVDWEDKRVVDWYRQCSGRHKNNRSNAQETIALMDLVGYEVEEEPQYRLKAGDNYLYFNLDGTVRGATKDNAIITKERLEQLPFDVDKAVESGIIEIEEMEEC